MTTLTLVSGIPRAGKSSLCDAIEASGTGFTHVPLDRYVRPVPAGQAFLDWIASPDCIDWDRVLAHLAILDAGVPCHSPRPDWESGWRSWISEGGALTTGPGRRMEPPRGGYLVAGTHAFAFPAAPRAHRATMQVFVETPDDVVATRLTSRRVAPHEARAVLHSLLAPNTPMIRRAVHAADLVIDGTAARPVQVRRFLDAHARFVVERGTPGGYVRCAGERDVGADGATGA
jgi:uridine kinase